MYTNCVLASWDLLRLLVFGHTKYFGDLKEVLRAIKTQPIFILVCIKNKNNVAVAFDHKFQEYCLLKFWSLSYLKNIVSHDGDISYLLLRKKSNGLWKFKCNVKVLYNTLPVYIWWEDLYENRYIASGFGLNNMVAIIT